MYIIAHALPCSPACLLFYLCMNLSLSLSLSPCLVIFLSLSPSHTNSITPFLSLALTYSLSMSVCLSLSPLPSSPSLPFPFLPRGTQPHQHSPAVLSVVDMEDSRLSMELLLVACKLLRLVLSGLPETAVLAVELDITSRPANGDQDDKTLEGPNSNFSLPSLHARSCMHALLTNWLVTWPTKVKGRWWVCTPTQPRPLNYQLQVSEKIDWRCL